MSKPKNTESIEFFKALQDHIDAGNIDAACSLNREQWEVLDCDDTSSTIAEAKALSAGLHLVSFDHQSAARVLSPYLGLAGANDQAQDSVIGKLKEPIVQGRVRAAIANTLYRRRNYEHAYKEALAAVPLLRQDTPASDYGNRLAAIWASAIAARTSWRLMNNGSTADRLLGICLSDLEPIRKEESWKSRAMVLEAFVLDIWAWLDWARGDTEKALAKIYRCLYLHGSGRADHSMVDSVRFGHALFQAARIESALVSSHRSQQSLDLLEQARTELRTASGLPSLNLSESKFPRDESQPGAHPLLHLIAIQRAAALVKAGSEESEAHLNHLDSRIEAFDSDVYRAEYYLVRCWYHRDSPQEIVDWASRILALHKDDKLPRRLQAEAELQLGIGLVQANDGAIRQAGIEHLLVARKLARIYKRPKIRAAAYLELAEAHSESDPAESVAMWKAANAILARTSTPYLLKRRDDIAITLKMEVPLVVSLHEHPTLNDVESAALFSLVERKIRTTGGSITDKELASDLNVKVSEVDDWLLREDYDSMFLALFAELQASNHTLPTDPSSVFCKWRVQHDLKSQAVIQATPDTLAKFRELLEKFPADTPPSKIAPRLGMKLDVLKLILQSQRAWAEVLWEFAGEQQIETIHGMLSYATWVWDEA